MGRLTKKSSVEQNLILALAIVAVFIIFAVCLGISRASAAPIRGLLAQSLTANAQAASAALSDAFEPDPNWVPAAREFYATDNSDISIDKTTGGLLYAFDHAVDYDTIYLGADLTRAGVGGATSLKLSANQTLIFTGRDPRSGVIHTYTGRQDGISYISGAEDSPRTFEMRDVVMRTTSAYCCFYAAPTAQNENVTLIFNNVDYAGPQGLYNYYGTNIFKGTNTFTLEREAFAEAHYLEFTPGSDTTIVDKSTYSSLYMGVGYASDTQPCGIIVDDGAKLTWSITGTNGIIGGSSWTNPPNGREFPITIGKNAVAHFEVASRFMGAVPTSARVPITIDENADFEVKQTTSAATAGMIRMQGDFIVSKGARCWFDMPYGGILFAYRTATTAATYRIQINEARSFGYNTLRSGSNFTCINMTVAPSTASAPLFLSYAGGQREQDRIVYYTTNASPVTAYPAYTSPDKIWEKPSPNTVLYFTAGKISGQTMRTGSYFSAAQTGAITSSSNAELNAIPLPQVGQGNIMSFGLSEASLDTSIPLTIETTSLVGTATPCATVSVRYSDDNNMEQILSTVTDTQGAWAIKIPDTAPLGLNSDIGLGVILDYRWRIYEQVAQVRNKAAPPTTQITYGDKSCGICHYANVAREHRKGGGCEDCHDSSLAYTQAVSSLAYPYSQSAKHTCGTTDAACHSSAAPVTRQWHGYRPVEISAAHRLSETTTPTAGDMGVSCGGYRASYPNCHGGTQTTWSTDSPFYFGTMDIASAHADYAHAVEQGITGDGVLVSGQIIATEAACGICHSKTSARSDRLIPTVYDTVGTARKANAFTCCTCHTGDATYADVSLYPTFLKSAYNNRSLCFTTERVLGVLTAQLEQDDAFYP